MSSDGCGSHSPSLSVSGSLCQVKVTCAATSSTLHYCYSSVIKNRKYFMNFFFRFVLSLTQGGQMLHSLFLLLLLLAFTKPDFHCQNLTSSDFSVRVLQVCAILYFASADSH